MKKIGIIILLFLYVISITELNQFIKLPVLFEHYSEHKHKNHHLSFISFLESHYMQHQDNDGDEEQESKMPFKSHDGCLTLVVSEFVPSNYSYTILKPVSNSPKNYFHRAEFFSTSSFLASIWQPPKNS